MKSTNSNDAGGVGEEIRFLIGSNCDLMRSSCKSILARQGYDCELAVDGFQALELITMSQFSGIILDQTLRYLTGSHLVTLSRFVPRLQNTPFVLFCLSKEIGDVKNRLSDIDLVSVFAKPPTALKLDKIFKDIHMVR